MKQIVYKIIPKCDHNEDEVYFGSTNIPLKIRWAKHKSHYNQYKNGKNHFIYCFIIFEKYGIENCEIIALEEFENLTNEELKEKEASFITSSKCVNKNIPNNFKNNPNYTIEYYDENKEKILKYVKEYYKNNIELITIKRRKKFCCECGGQCWWANKSYHFKTKKHLKYLNENTTQNI